MEDTTKFLLPKPDFGRKDTMAPKSQPHFLTPSGMTLLPRHKQPPPMYGPRGSTFAPKFLAQQKDLQDEKPQERYYCEPCDMEFQSINDMRRHRSLHERCPVDGCKYKAHPSLMDKHVTELHTSGIYAKIKKISTPEEIAAWREERRRKYPTVANTQMRQLAQEQRQRRGERLEEKKSRFGRHEDRKRARNIEKPHEQRQLLKKSRMERNKQGCNKRPQRKVVQTAEKKEPIPSAKSKPEDESSEDVGKIRMFKGTSKMDDYEHCKPKKPHTNNVLSGLLGMYGSDDDDDESETDENTKTRQSPLEDEVQQTQNCEAKEGDTDSLSKQHKPVTNDLNTSSKNSTCFNEGTPKIPSEHKNTTSPQESEIYTKETNICVNSNHVDAITTPNFCASNLSQDNDQIDAENNLNDSSDDAPNEAPIERNENVHLVPCTIANLITSRSNLENEASTSKSTKIENEKRTLQQKRKFGLNYRKVKLRKQNTMLEKLLEPDIRHERNVLLQCVRFVCQNNFFGIGTKNSTDKNVSV